MMVARVSDSQQEVVWSKSIHLQCICTRGNKRASVEALLDKTEGSGENFIRQTSITQDNIESVFQAAHMLLPYTSAVQCVCMVKPPLHAFLHKRVSRCLLVAVQNVVWEFLFISNEVGAIVRPINARDATLGYKNLNSHEKTSIVH